jgi:hypothetical protein
VPLQPLRFQDNTFTGNQKALEAAWADNSQFINNYFEGAAGLDSDGLYTNGTNILAALNTFTNLKARRSATRPPIPTTSSRRLFRTTRRPAR